ncbi:MAG TPA: Cof-type HAD-IIB family hydrolase [bacterium]|nr:Cof-type HAD-IIB family hydrolase [bacterium]
MPVQLIAIDLDDTLLTPDLTIHPANLLSVRHALSVGINVILASGRTIESMTGFAEELGLPGRGLPMICVNGSEIRDVDSGAIIRRKTLSREACLVAIRELESHGLPAQAYDDDGIIASRRNDWTDRDCQITGLSARIARSPEEIASEPRSKLLSAGTPEQVARFAPLLREKLAGIAEILISKPYFIEILPPGADKGEALAWVAQTRGISRQNVMAIGDSGNDVGMVSWAGLGCAPADARPEVIAAARHVSSLPHDKGAVAELIDKYALQETHNPVVANPMNL